MTAAATALRPARVGRATGRRALPGLGLSLGVTLAWLGLIVLIPLAALAIKPWQIGISGVVAVLLDARVLAAFRLSFGAALLAAIISLPLGLLFAWVITRYRFPGRRLLDALVDLPFALPTAVAGLAMTALLANNGWLGAPLAAAFGWQIAYRPVGVLIALVFVALPFMIRSVEPVLRDLALEGEEAAATLGATRMQTLWRVVLPALAPALITGFGLGFGRAVGEYGSVIFIAGNMPMATEIAPLLIVTKLEQYDDAAAAAIGLAMLVLAFLILLALNLLQRWVRRGRA
ncbi:sulfate ABC transporter permease subunit CysT [Plastoroseomonas arctica]|uniref:Sulfate transport system permease protein CysT n=1 Tax=Plastoroseomonas arctica TaxID=1509237 RepID=A0AAF1JXX8_9PROT|nr:sulfate ABC transporter permease subunit CysT [Plastoroseomonas arctica]MBR0653904.1 sulfate ABC transporter permease subunit CysT [Plastoroseomonas arctica]